MRHITQCFDKKLRKLVRDTASLESLNKTVRYHLEGVPCEVGRFHQGILTLTVKDAVWAARLRYEIPALRDKLRQEGLHQLSNIEVSISPTRQAQAPHKPTRKPMLSEDAKKMLEASAKACEYEPLKKALARLSKHQASDGNKSTSG